MDKIILNPYAEDFRCVGTFSVSLIFQAFDPNQSGLDVSSAQQFVVRKQTVNIYNTDAEATRKSLLCYFYLLFLLF